MPATRSTAQPSWRAFGLLGEASSVRYRISRSASRDISRADSWWRENRPSSPDAFAQELDAAIQQAAAHPDSGVVYGVLERELVRRLFTKTTRNFLYYAVSDGVVVVLRIVGAAQAEQPRFTPKTDLS
jgi:plasmid stabilization system protein ParE